MNLWEQCKSQFATKFLLTKEEQEHIPAIYYDAFAANDKGNRVLFGAFSTYATYSEGPGHSWRYLGNSEKVTANILAVLFPHKDQIEEFDTFQGTALYQDRFIKWHQSENKWIYLNHWTVHFESPSTSDAETQAKTASEGSDDDQSEDKAEQIILKKTDEDDTTRVESLLQRAETTVTLAIQKLQTRLSTPQPSTPRSQTSPFPSSSRLLPVETTQVPMPPVSKGKQRAPAPLTPRTKASGSSQPAPGTQPQPTQPLSNPPTGNTPGAAPPVIYYPPASGPPAAPPPAPPPPPPIVAAPMAQANTPHLISTTPELYDGQGNKVLAFWNILKNYFTVNEDIFNTDHKKVASALTYFKCDTQAGEWASDRMATAIAAQPTNYGTWQAFKDAFKVQFIPPQTELEALSKLHATPQGNREFNEWYQEWSQHARHANVDENTKMFTFCNTINSAISNKIASQSPQPATLAELVECARDLDQNWHMYAKPLGNQGTQRQGCNPCVCELSAENSNAEINATQGQHHTPFKKRGKLTPEQCQYRFNNNLCMYCGKQGHKAINCKAPRQKRPRSSFTLKVRQMDTVPEEDLDKLSLSDSGSRVTHAFHNSFTPLEDLDETGDTTAPSFAGSLL